MTPDQGAVPLPYEPARRFAAHEVCFTGLSSVPSIRVVTRRVVGPWPSRSCATGRFRRLRTARVHCASFRSWRPSDTSSRPFLARIVAVGENDGRVWAARELIEGQSLAERLARNGPMGTAECARVASQIAAALGELHRHGVLHRDMPRPGHVLIEPTGAVRVIDAAPAPRVPHAGRPRDDGHAGVRLARVDRGQARQLQEVRKPLAHAAHARDELLQSLGPGQRREAQVGDGFAQRLGRERRPPRSGARGPGAVRSRRRPGPRVAALDRGTAAVRRARALRAPVVSGPRVAGFWRGRPARHTRHLAATGACWKNTARCTRRKRTRRCPAFAARLVAATEDRPARADAPHCALPAWNARSCTSSTITARPRRRCSQ